jgi:uncharacterized protein YjiS (DUF1127 family)
MAYSLSGERPTIAAWPIGIAAALLRRVAQLAKARRQRIALAALLELDEYRLWDLGIARADLNRALRAEEFDIAKVRANMRRMDVTPPVHTARL